MLVCYTAILGRIGDLPRAVPESSAKFVAFVDTPERRRGACVQGWEPREPLRVFADSRRTARWHKVLSHILFPEAEYTLWVDGCLRVVDAPALLLGHLRDLDICVFRHAERSCVYRELEACVRLYKDDLATMYQQIARYRREGYPYNNGLAETTAVLRRHTPHVARLNSAWWSEIEHGSVRDQLSFDYVCWRLGIRYATFARTRYDNPHFELHLETHEESPQTDPAPAT